MVTTPKACERSADWDSAYAVLADEQTRRDYDPCADSVDFDKAMTLIKNSPRPLTLQLVRPVEEAQVRRVGQARREPARARALDAQAAAQRRRRRGEHEQSHHHARACVSSGRAA